MLLSDVLKVIGTSELRDFPWGHNVVALVNSFVSEQAQLTIASTGTDLEMAVSKVDAAQRDLLLRARVGMISHVDQAASANDADLLDEQDEKNKTRSIISIAFSAILCLIAVVLTVSMSYSASINGTEIDVEGIGSFLKIIHEIISSLQ